MSISAFDFSSEKRISYKKIVERIEQAVRQGEFRTGERLPTQRELAKTVGATVVTISRAYSELQQRGLIKSEVGRGTYVTGWYGEYTDRLTNSAVPTAIDLTINRPPTCGYIDRFREALAALSKRLDLPELMRHQPSAGMAEHRVAGAKWISELGLKSTPADIIITNGVQHGLMVVLAAFSRPGDKVIVEELTYPGLRLVEKTLHLKLIGCPIDDDGMNADAFQELCEQHHPTFVVVNPIVHNPTCSTMSARRRETIVEVAQRHRTKLIENDIYGSMPEKRPPTLSSLYRDGSYYLTGSSKCIGAGLRTGFIVSPVDDVSRICSNIRATTWMPSVLLAEIMCGWINDGTAAEIIDWNRNESFRRQAIAKQILNGYALATDPSSYQVWLKLPPWWEEQRFVSRANEVGVRVTPAASFYVGKGSAPDAVRISLGDKDETSSIKTGLERLETILSERPVDEISS